MMRPSGNQQRCIMVPCLLGWQPSPCCSLLGQFRSGSISAIWDTRHSQYCKHRMRLECTPLPDDA